MAASISNDPAGSGAVPSCPRFARETRDASSGQWVTRWLLKKNCSISPRQFLGTFALLSLLSLGIGVGFWLHGATLVLPFAGAELLVLGIAMFVHARHATDHEEICLAQSLTVVHADGKRLDRVEFEPPWVRVEPQHGDGSLIELSGQGKRTLVGRFVRPDQRRRLAEELRSALRRWQPGATYAAA